MMLLLYTYSMLVQAIVWDIYPEVFGSIKCTIAQFQKEKENNEIASTYNKERKLISLGNNIDHSSDFIQKLFHMIKYLRYVAGTVYVE